METCPMWKSRFTLILVLALSLTAFVGIARADQEEDPWEKLKEFVTLNGGVDSGGGDGFVEEFIGYARLATRIAKPRWEITGVDFSALEAKLLATKVEMVDKVLKDGDRVEKDALNFPKENRILVSRLRWKELNSNQKMILALHEYLGLLRIPDSGYETSQRLLNRENGASPVPVPKDPVSMEVKSENCPTREERAETRNLIVHVREINEQNEARIKALADATSGMISQLRRLGSERVRLAPDPVPRFEEFLVTLKTYGLITGVEALEQELVQRFPPECKIGVAQAIRMFLPVERQQAQDARLQLEVWKESLKTLIKFLKEQDLKPPMRSYNRATLVFMHETMLDHLNAAVWAYSKLNSDIGSLSLAFLAAD